MTKHQIILLGKDITSVYHGIKEFRPDYIHLLYTEATRGIADTMFPLLPAHIRKCAYQTDPYDGNRVQEVCRVIHQEYEGEFLYHLSEGTKPMALAAFDIAREMKSRAFYLTQLGELVWLDTFEILPMRSMLDNEEIIKLSGNILSQFHDIKELREENIQTSKQIKRFIENYPQEHARIMKFFGVICHRQISRLPPSKLLTNELRFKTKNGTLLFTQRGQILLRTSNPNALYLYFKASWWETLVAHQVRIWTEQQKNPPEAWQNVLFQTDSENTQSKNEVDVLVNNKQKLIFIECKSGQVTQNDIYKIDGVRETYGGDISRAVLASYYPVETYLLEKCRDLQINVFAPPYFEDRISHLYELPGWLDQLTRELQL
ncbi:hypothetical protein M2480_000616 [Parabacteroides sp. PFB2-12]|uniref:Card1-like endonuclease domain-containing protein n=1 Tax=Parabacteroides sp. PFB2-12 TaxID=2940652 RepID=UPI0024756838|nr:DUF1887 family CARF protein [Parabacteroides sp. PFB2-12]MDH6389651.1 hypothetical protein [Parabacteroides sp. PFB2-12]